MRREPKTTAGTRSITISSFTAHLMHDHLDRFAVSAKDALVFPNGAINPIAASSFLSSHFGPARAVAGLTCRFHDLRHTSVALAIAPGAHPKAIQSRKGQVRCRQNAVECARREPGFVSTRGSPTGR